MLTWLTPQVHLDTVVQVGSVPTRFEAGPPAFALGAMTASFLFFFALGYGARRLRPAFAGPAPGGCWR